MSKYVLSLLLFLSLINVEGANAEADLEVNTPAINVLKIAMQARHSLLAPLYSSGAIGFTKDGLIAIHDATVLPLKDRVIVNSLVTAENEDRVALYKEIAKATKHPEWEGGIRDTFAGRWIDRAQKGWWYQGENGWVKK